MSIILFILSVALLLLVIAVWVGFASSLLLTSHYELKQKAQHGDQQAKVVYGLTHGGRQIFVALLFGGLIAVCLLTTLLDAVMPSLLASVFTALLVAFFGILVPFLYGEKLGLALTTWFAPVAAKMLTVMQPVTRPIAERIDIAIGKKSVLYSKEQLLKIIDSHADATLTDISPDEALLVRNSLSFSDRYVKDIMVPRNMVSMVASHAEIGPLMMDEMHQSGHSRFPVFQHDNPDQIVGMLYLHNLVGDKKSGAVSKLMSSKVYFVHEELDLNHVLHAFLKTKNHLFIVVNNFEEFVGVISIEDILEQILGKQIVDEFDNYENLREVAQLRAKKEASKNNHV